MFSVVNGLASIAGGTCFFQGHEPVRAVAKSGPRPGLWSSELRAYDVLPDGRFISVSQAYGDDSTTALSGEVRVVLNWTEELKRLVPAK